MSLYWSSRSLPLKESFNRVLNKSILVNTIKSPRNWKETNSSAYQNELPQNLPIQSMLMTGVISGVVTPKDKIKSNPLTNRKVRSITRKFYSSSCKVFFLKLTLVEYQNCVDIMTFDCHPIMLFSHITLQNQQIQRKHNPLFEKCYLAEWKL